MSKLEHSTEDFHFFEIGEYDDEVNIVLNNKLELHIKHEDGCYSVDFYKYIPQNKDLDEFTESDLIHSLWISQDDIENEDEDEDQ